MNFILEWGPWQKVSLDDKTFKAIIAKLFDSIWKIKIARYATDSIN